MIEKINDFYYKSNNGIYAIEKHESNKSGNEKHWTFIPFEKPFNIKQLNEVLNNLQKLQNISQL